MKKMRMGNDEFILYIRKWNPGCGLTNEVLGRKIWEWIIANDNSAIQIGEQNCLWDKQGLNVAPDLLPKMAMQFEFSQSILCSLYDYLDNV